MKSASAKVHSRTQRSRAAPWGVTLSPGEKPEPPGSLQPGCRVQVQEGQGSCAGAAQRGSTGPPAQQSDMN